VARATGFGVVNAGVVIDQLRAFAEIQAVENAIAAFRTEHGINFVARDPSANGNGMRNEPAVLVLLALNRGHVKTIGTFRLNF
jgi:hypothetical protein